MKKIGFLFAFLLFSNVIELCPQNIYYYSESWDKKSIDLDSPPEKVIFLTKMFGFVMTFQDSIYCNEILKLKDENLKKAKKVEKRLDLSTVVIIQTDSTSDTLGFRGFDYFYYNSNIYELIDKDLLDIVTFRMPDIHYWNYETSKSHYLNGTRDK